jgi:DNA-binding transcriptional regulator of glucitol operon
VYRRFTRPGWVVGHLLVVLAALVCLRLAWWQWGRWHNDADGTVQNLGYAVLWPIFGASFVYMWIRFLKLEVAKDDAEDAEVAEFAAQIETDLDPAPPAKVTEADITERPARRAPEPNRPVTLSMATVDPNDEDDPELAAYNRALAELAEKDQRRAV